MQQVGRVLRHFEYAGAARIVKLLQTPPPLPKTARVRQALEDARKRTAERRGLFVPAAEPAQILQRAPRDKIARRARQLNHCVTDPVFAAHQ